MNEIAKNNMTIINSLNKVEGFDPSALLRRLTSDNGEEQFYLDVKYRKLWFRLKYPQGKITKHIVKLENDYAIIESKVYLDRNDPEEAYVSSAMAQRWRKDDDIYGMRYVETAETAAVGRALADAGFGIQFSEPGEDQDSSPVDSPVTMPSGGTVSDEEDEELPEETAKPQSAKGKKATDNKTKKLDESMPVEELMKIMTLEDAKGYVIPFGHYSGRTLGDICMEKPEAVNWYIESYKGKNNILRAGAQILLNAAG